MLEVVPTSRCIHGHATGSGQNSSAITGSGSEMFTRWLHHRYAPVKLPPAEAYRFITRYLVILQIYDERFCHCLDMVNFVSCTAYIKTVKKILLLHISVELAYSSRNHVAHDMNLSSSY